MFSMCFLFCLERGGEETTPPEVHLGATFKNIGICPSRLSSKRSLGSLGAQMCGRIPAMDFMDPQRPLYAMQCYTIS